MGQAPNNPTLPIRPQLPHPTSETGVAHSSRFCDEWGQMTLAPTPPSSSPNQLSQLIKSDPGKNSDSRKNSDSGRNQVSRA